MSEAGRLNCSLSTIQGALAADSIHTDTVNPEYFNILVRAAELIKTDKSCSAQIVSGRMPMFDFVPQPCCSPKKVSADPDGSFFIAGQMERYSYAIERDCFEGLLHGPYDANFVGSRLQGLIERTRIAFARLLSRVIYTGLVTLPMTHSGNIQQTPTQEGVKAVVAATAADITFDFVYDALSHIFYNSISTASYNEVFWIAPMSVKGALTKDMIKKPGFCMTPADVLGKYPGALGVYPAGQGGYLAIVPLPENVAYAPTPGDATKVRTVMFTKGAIEVFVNGRTGISLPGSVPSLNKYNGGDYYSSKFEVNNPGTLGGIDYFLDTFMGAIRLDPNKIIFIDIPKTMLPTKTTI